MIELHKKILIGLGISFSIFLSGCSTIQLVSNYDEDVDKQTQALQKKMDIYFISMKNLQGKPTSYKENQKFYEEVLADINALNTRAAVIYKNELTQEQVSQLKMNFAELVLLHKQCFDDKNKLTPELKKTIKSQGADLSLDCQKIFGSPQDLKARGDIELQKDYIPSMQRSFESIFRAIMKFELAKKRGDSEEKK